MSSQDRQIIPAGFFFDNNLEYLRGCSTDKKYTASTTKYRAARYELKGIKDMVHNLWSPIKEGDFKRLHLNDIEDMLLLIVQNKLNNLDGNVVVHLAASLRMFTRRTVIQERVEDLQLGVESYQKKLNLTKPRTRVVDMSRRQAYTTLSNPQGYNKTMRRRQWTSLDRKRTRIMIKSFNQKLLDRRIMRSLEKFIGGREYGEDL
ncbi:hypothetical protein Tco_0223018 [Tanacetum coccineum]